MQLYLSDTTATRFGAGWALAEQSRLILGQTSQGAPAAIWLDGDGSYVIFRKVGSMWQSPPGETSVLRSERGITGFGASAAWPCPGRRDP